MQTDVGKTSAEACRLTGKESWGGGTPERTAFSDSRRWQKLRRSVTQYRPASQHRDGESNAEGRRRQDWPFARWHDMVPSSCELAMQSISQTAKLKNPWIGTREVR